MNFANLSGEISDPLTATFFIDRFYLNYCFAQASAPRNVRKHLLICEEACDPVAPEWEALLPERDTSKMRPSPEPI